MEKLKNGDLLQHQNGKFLRFRGMPTYDLLHLIVLSKNNIQKRQRPTQR